MKKIMLFVAVLATFVSCEISNYKTQVDSKHNFNPYDSTYDYHIKYRALSMNAKEKIYLAHLADIDHPIDSAQSGGLTVVEMNGNVSREGIYCIYTRNRANRDEIRVVSYLIIYQKKSHGTYSGNVRFGSDYKNYKTIADIDSSSIVLKGDIGGAPKGTAYLIDYNAKIVDSLISEDGSFEFRNNIDATKTYLVEYIVYNSYNYSTDDASFFFQPSYKLRNGAKVDYNLVKHIWMHPVVECQQLTDSTVHYVIDGYAPYRKCKNVYLTVDRDAQLFKIDNGVMLFESNPEIAQQVCNVVDGKYHFEGVASNEGFSLFTDKSFIRYVWFGEFPSILNQSKNQ